MQKWGKRMNQVNNTQNEEFINIKEELNINKKEENIISKKRKNRRIIIGAVFSFFAVIGVISIILTGVGITNALLDNTEEKIEYAQKLSSLAIYDPLPVEDVSLIDKKILYLSGIWAAVINEDTEQFEKNEYGETLLPAIVVDSYIESVFGQGLDLIYETFDDSGITYIFDEEKQAYIIPVTSIPTGYTIEVAEIEQGLFSTEKKLTVAYLAAATSWTDVEKTPIVKYVDYIFEKQNDDYYLVAIRESEKVVEVSAEVTPTPTTEPIPVPEGNEEELVPAAQAEAAAESETEQATEDTAEDTTEDTQEE